MPTPFIEDAVAIVPVRDIHRTVDFYVDTLNFERRLVTDDGQFAIAVHGEAAIHFLKADDASALEATANHFSIYLWVNGVDQLYCDLTPNLQQLDEDRVRAPFDQPYGMREFHVKDPDGCLLMFGQPVEQTE